jgi:soluble lytic murein transglycosylase-like protein
MAAGFRISNLGLVMILPLIWLGGCAATAAAPQPLSRPAVQQIVAEEALRMGVPVSLALAVAHAESNFNPAAESPMGARGVMQIMPATARGEYGIEADLLWQPRLNVRLGLHFLKRLLERYRGRIDLALSYYNGGSAVGDLPYARVIPATAKYVKRVRRLQRRYRGMILQEAA